MKKVCVNLNVVNDFQRSIANFTNEMEANTQNIANAFSNLNLQCDQLFSQYQELNNKALKIKEMINIKKSEYTNKKSTLQKRLASTPKTITKTDSEGNSSTVANPEYDRLSREINQLENKIRRIEMCSNKLLATTHKIENDNTGIKKASNLLTSSKKTIESQLNSIKNCNEKAAGKLRNIQEALDGYLNVSL